MFFIADATDHYKVEWENLNVTEITAYKVDSVTPQVPNYAFSTAGVSTSMLAAFAFFGFERHQLFSGRKTGIFWWGLIIFGFAMSGLFAVLWEGLVIYSNFFPEAYAIAETAVSLAFLTLSFFMMKWGAKKDPLTYSPTEPWRTQRIKFDFSQRNNRGLIYLLASVILNTYIFAAGVPYNVINFVGFLLALPFTFFYSSIFVIFPLTVFGFFIEIFVVCEFLIYAEHKLEKITKEQPPNQQPANS